MKKASRWIVGIAIVLVLSTVAVGVFMPTMIGLLFGGMFFAVGGAGIGGLGAEQLESEGGDCIPGGGASAVTASQSEYVRSIVGVGKDLGVSKQGQIVAVMVALAESGIQNYANDGGNHFNFNIGTPQGTQFWLDAVKKHSLKLPHDAVGKDADSVGLFQQRPSAGWADSGNFKAADDPEAAINRLMNPEFSARAFFGGPGGVPNPGLLDVEGWEDMEPTVAAQTVQGSNYPDAYAEWEDQATELVEAESDAPAISEGEGSSSEGDDESDSDSAEASAGSDEDDPSSSSSSGSSELSMPMKEGTEITSKFGGRDSPGGVGSTDHKGLDFGDSLGSPINAAADGEVVAAGSAEGFGQWVVIDHTIDGKKWSTVYGHVTPDGIKVKKGDKVKSGDQVAELGNEGASTGPHLHFETWDGGRFSGGEAVDPEKAVSGEHEATGGDAADASGGGCSTEDASSGGGDGAEATGDVKEIIAEGEKQEGVDYSWGGGGKDGPSEGFAQGAGIKGFDCSSLMQYMVYQATGYELPRTAAEQYEHTKGNQVAKAGDGVDDLKPGDLLFWGDSAATIDHMAMYVGDGKMIEAPRTGLKVRTTEARVEGDSRFFGATRINYSEKKA